jgi:hypothetical protein
MSWASHTELELGALIKREKPQVAYFHNVPLVSPATYYACAEARVRAVQTPRNYRLLCPVEIYIRKKLPGAYGDL